MFDIVFDALGWLETLIADHLYPHRYVVTPILLAAVAAAVFVAYRRGVHRILLQHRLATTVIGVPALVVVLVAGNYLLSPLWTRSFLEEESPLAAAPTAVPLQPMTTPAPGSTPASVPPVATPASQPFQPMTLFSGTVEGADDFHFGRGDALIIEAEPGIYVLRFEMFSVRNGPDLFVYLSEDATGRTVDEALNLGELKATDGAFNYEIPATIDVSKVKSAVVWCRQFRVLFAHAELMPVMH